MKITIKKVVMLTSTETYHTVVDVPDHLNDQDQKDILDYVRQEMDIADLEDLDWGDMIRHKENINDIEFDIVSMELDEPSDEE